MKVKLYTVYHKLFVIPSHEFIIPIQVGKKNNPIDLKISGDDTGDNISVRNPNFCELTALYWIWKNDNEYDIVGLNHYRRFLKLGRQNIFSSSKYNISSNEINTVSNNIEKSINLLEKYEWILPYPSHLHNSLKTQYCNKHIPEEWEILIQVISEKYPQYMPFVEKTFNKSNVLQPYNMFITDRKNFEKYADWVFSILFEVDRRISTSNYPFQARAIGYMAERLFTLYMSKNEFKIKYVPIYFITENEDIVSKSVFELSLDIYYKYIWKIFKKII
ncbi:MAG: DUF4422 domain-containing protein [Bacteroidota bacterium]|nr:DUF4422 domain-containing protein [Bacteroidota bacterium]